MSEKQQFISIIRCFSLNKGNKVAVTDLCSDTVQGKRR